MPCTLAKSFRHCLILSVGEQICLKATALLELLRPRRRDLVPHSTGIFNHSNEHSILAPEGHYLEQNPAHRELLGYSDEELLGQTPSLHMGREAFEDIVSELAQKGVYRGEVVSHAKTGEVRHIELSAFTTRDGSGDPICYVSIKRNVTERKRAEEALRSSEAELTDSLTTPLSVALGRIRRDSASR